MPRRPDSDPITRRITAPRGIRGHEQSDAVMSHPTARGDDDAREPRQRAAEFGENA